MKFGQLIEHNMSNIFLEKSYIDCGGDTFLGTFSIEHISRSII